MIENSHHIDDDDNTQLRFGNGDCDALPLVLPPVPGDGRMMMMMKVTMMTSGKKRVIYTISEYQPLLDSSNMTMDDWIQVGRIQKKQTNTNVM